MLNGISFTSVKITGGVISSLIPIFLIRRYKSFDYYFSCVFVGALLYAFFFVMLFVGISAVPSLAQKWPLNSFDAIIYGMFVFPFGAFWGMLAVPLINYILNKKHVKPE